MNTLVEGKFGHGAIKTNCIHHWASRKARGIAKATVPFNWLVGYDVEQDIGTLPRLNQYQSLECGGEAHSQVVSVDLVPYKQAGSAKSIYSRVFYPGGGTTYPALENQLLNNGANTEQEVPSSPADGSPVTEIFAEDRSWETPELITSAYKNAGYNSVSVSLDMDSIANALQQYKRVTMMFRGQNNGTWESYTPLPPVSSNPNEIWGHFVFLKSAKIINGVNSIEFINSWGTAVGINGVQCFNQNYLDSGYIDEIVAWYKPTPPVTNQTVTVTKPTWLTWFYNLLIHIFG